MKFLPFFVSLLGCVLGDIYLHNPRGSNNRLDEDGRERNNANRLFDSQNNDRGGYNVGSLYYYSDSKLQIEWTNQHSCMNPNNHCELIIQYMCGDNVRDGSVTSTIPQNPSQCDNYDCNTDLRYGMHEDYDFYQNCQSRTRNKGLFTADQNLKGDRAIHTRQNPNGNRRGYECPEERDYYPYWHPSPWKDIAIMTNDARKCDYYQAESENVKGRYHCVIDRQIIATNKGLEIPNNKADCDAFRWPQNDPNGARGSWSQNPSHGLASPVCIENQFSRDNHLGNGIGGYPLSFNWTIPDLPHENCALRIRYNISTDDYAAWDAVNASNNKPNKKNFADIDLSRKYGLASKQEAEDRGYVFKNNPEVRIFSEISNLDFRLAINTAQFGRTFQDRSHTFAIRSRPARLEGETIRNINVRGKRGNIVQVYPAVEYDFVPNTLEVTKDQYVHFQWTGSNSNPNNNDGQGRAGTDRSNVVLQKAASYNEGAGLAYVGTEKHGHWGRSYPEMIDETKLLGLSRDDLIDLAILRKYQFGGEMSHLDDAGTYFDLGPRQVTQAGIYHYLSTRNNNFSNRSQKGRIIVTSAQVEEDSIGSNGGKLELEDNTNVVIRKGALDRRVNMRIEKWPKEEGMERLSAANIEAPDDNFVSDVYVMYPEETITVEGEFMEVKIPVSPASVEDVTIYRTGTGSSSWTKVDVEVKGSMAHFQTRQGGVYVAVGYKKSGLIAGAVIAALIGVVLIAVASVLYFRKNPESFSSMKRSFASQV